VLAAVQVGAPSHAPARSGEAIASRGAPASPARS
jgi:hypothetical protein